MGLMVKNVIGLSDAKRHYSGASAGDGDYSFSLPRYVTIGMSFKRGDYTWSFDSESIFGRYGGIGKKTAEFWFLRAGVEKAAVMRYLKLRAGLILPVIARTSTIGNIRDDIPDPKIGGSAGAGLEFGRYFADFAVYGDPGKSYVEQDPEITFTVTVGINF